MSVSAALIRALVGIFGILAVAWGLTTLPIFWQQASLEHIAHRIIAGEPYKIQALHQQIATIEAVENAAICRPVALWSAAIIRLRIVEESILERSGSAAVAPQMQSLDHSIRRSLSCSPAEPFLWLILYWVETTQSGFQSKYTDYLKMSYRLGPNEGWVMLKRNPFVFAHFDRLPPALVAAVVDEFITILDNELYQQAIATFVGPAWQARNVILPRLGALPLRVRRTFAKALRDRNLDVSIPEEGPSRSGNRH